MRNEIALQRLLRAVSLVASLVLCGTLLLSDVFTASGQPVRPGQAALSLSKPLASLPSLPDTAPPGAEELEGLIRDAILVDYRASYGRDLQPSATLGEAARRIAAVVPESPADSDLVEYMVAATPDREIRAALDVAKAPQLDPKAVAKDIADYWITRMSRNPPAYGRFDDLGVGVILRDQHYQAVLILGEEVIRFAQPLSPTVLTGAVIGQLADRYRSANIAVVTTRYSQGWTTPVTEVEQRNSLTVDPEGRFSAGPTDLAGAHWARVKFIVNGQDVGPGRAIGG